ncbi:hypothetical protein [Mesobacillus maritimus]|uniref:hypothetical protein n=1 Tax=Mesobacillus maritimus TaxID=1643336 RepID=UPI00384D59CE
MKLEKLIADELQSMFLEDRLPGLKEEYVNSITRELRLGIVTLPELIRKDPLLKPNISDAKNRVLLKDYY